MAEKVENEITVKVLCSKDELLDYLEKQGFKAGMVSSFDDSYYIPSKLDIYNITTREILSNAIIFRHIVDDGITKEKVTFKMKKIADNGDIISQKAFNCQVYNMEDAKKLFEALGYHELMNIKENDITYARGQFELVVKFVENSDTLIEIETEANTERDTIEKIKASVLEMNMPVDKSNYFIKKAENELNKVLKR